MCYSNLLQLLAGLPEWNIEWWISKAGWQLEFSYLFGVNNSLSWSSTSHRWKLILFLCIFFLRLWESAVTKKLCRMDLWPIKLCYWYIRLVAHTWWWGGAVVLPLMPTVWIKDCDSDRVWWSWCGCFMNILPSLQQHLWLADESEQAARTVSITHCVILYRHSSEHILLHDMINY